MSNKTKKGKAPQNQPPSGAQGKSNAGTSSQTQKPVKFPKNKPPTTPPKKPLKPPPKITSIAATVPKKNPAPVAFEKVTGPSTKSSTPKKTASNVPPSRSTALTGAHVVQTSSAETSRTAGLIWRGSEFNVFRTAVKSLQGVSDVPGRPLTHSLSSYRLRQINTQGFESDRVLSLSDETELADGFAFLAAPEKGGDSVSAVTIEEHSNPAGLVIRLTANDGLPPEVFSSFQKMTVLLEQQANDSGLVPRLSQESLKYSNPIFDAIVQLSQRRIRQRLDPSKNGKKPLHVKVKEIAAQSLETSPRPVPRSQAFTVAVERFCSTCSQAKSSPNPENLMSVIRQAHNLVREHKSEDMEALHMYLPNSKTDPHSEEAMILRKMMSLARYWTFCSFLTKMARKYPSLFSQIKVLSVLPKQQKSFRQSPYRVHSEVQLVLFYGVNPHRPCPRVIGSSKKACYLCDLFIQKYGQYFLSKTHGHLYPKWTVVDLEGLQADSVFRIRVALKEVRLYLQQRATELKTDPRRYPPPVESSAGSFEAFPSDLTLSTVKGTAHSQEEQPTWSLSPVLTSRDPSIRSPLPTLRVRSPVLRSLSVTPTGPSRLNHVINADDIPETSRDLEDAPTPKPLSPVSKSTPRGSRGTVTHEPELDQVSTISSIPSSVASPPPPPPPPPSPPTILHPGKLSTSKICKDCFLDVKAGSINKLVTFESTASPPNPPGKSYQRGKVTSHLLTPEEVARGGFEAFRCRDLKEGEERSFDIPDVGNGGGNPTLEFYVKNGKDVLRTICTLE